MHAKKCLNTVFRPPILLVVHAKSSNGIATHEWREQERLWSEEKGMGVVGYIFGCHLFWFCFSVVTSL